MTAVVGGVGALATAATRAPRWLLPTSPLPKPTGPNPVGTTVVEVHGPRRLPTQLWYPATSAEGPAVRLFPSPGAPAAIASRYGLPARMLRPLRRVRGHAHLDAPAAGEVRGLVVLVHGWMGFRSIHADLGEQLASDGWLVVAADHVGGALVTQYADGSAVGLQDSLMPVSGDPGYGRRTVALIDRYAEDVAAVLHAVDVGIPGHGAGWVGRGLGDREVLLVGQSTGGGAAVRVAAQDQRVDAVVGLDPWVEPVWPPERRALTQPMTALRSEQWAGNANDADLAAMPGVELRVVPGTGHTDLTGIGYLSPLTRLLGLARCPPAVAHDATMAAVYDLTAASTTGSTLPLDTPTTWRGCGRRG